MSKVSAKSTFFRWMRYAVFSGCFAGIILFLCQYDNKMSQTGKALQGAWAFLLFAIVLLTLQKVRFLNWQSLVVTIGYFPFAFLECKSYFGSPDLFTTHILETVTRWLLFMVIADMIATKRVRRIDKIRFFRIVFFCLMLVLMATLSHGSSISNYLPFLLLCFIPIEESDWDEAVNGLLTAGFFTFLFIAADSFVRNPFFGVMHEEFMQLNPGQGGRWFGDFLNIGAFGQFLGLSTALAVCGLYRSSDKFGRLSVPYFASWFWLAGSVFLASLNATRNYMVGVAGLLMVLFVFGWRKSGKKGMIIRGGVVALLVIVIAVAIIRFGFYVISPDFDYDKLLADLMNTPLKLFPAGTEYIANKFRLANEGFDSGYGEGNVFAPGTIWSYLNLLTSFRLGICYDFLCKSSFYGTSGSGMMYGDYFAFNAHNQYVQSLYVYGFLAGGVYVIYAVAGWIGAIAGSVKTRKEHFYLPMIVLTMMLGMWFGEMSTIFYPLTFVGFFMLTPVLVDCRHRKKAKMSENEGENAPADRMDQADGESRPVESVKTKIAIPSAIVAVIGLVAVFTAVMIVSKNCKLNVISTVEADNHIRLGSIDRLNEPEGEDGSKESREEGDAKGLFEPDNGLYSARDVRNGTVVGTILAEDEEIQKKALASYFEGAGTISFHTPNGRNGDLIVLEFDAKTDYDRPLSLEVYYYDEQVSVVELDNEWNRYYVPFITGMSLAENDTEKTNEITYGKTKETKDVFFRLRYTDAEGQSCLVTYDDFCVVNYGEKTLASEVKTGRYLLEPFEREFVSAEPDGAMWGNTVVSDGRYLYMTLGSDLYICRPDKRYSESVFKYNDSNTVGILRGLGDVKNISLCKDKKVLLVMSKEDGAYFVDVSLPSEPKVFSHYATIDQCVGGEIYGNYAFLCNGQPGLEIVDITNVSKPRQVKVIEQKWSNYQSCIISNDILFALPPDQKRFDVYNVKDVTNPELLGIYTLDGMGLGLAAKDDYLYIATSGDSRWRGTGEGIICMGTGSGSGIEVFDISDPTAITLVSRKKIDGRMNYYPFGTWDLVLQDNRLYLSEMCAGLYIFDISKPTNPVREKTFSVRTEKDTLYYRQLDLATTVMPYRFAEETHGSIIHTAIIDGVAYCLTDMGIYRTSLFE